MYLFSLLVILLFKHVSTFFNLKLSNLIILQAFVDT